MTSKYGVPYVFVGSAYPNPSALRQGIDLISDIFGRDVECISGYFDKTKPTWLRNPSLKFTNFVELLRDQDGVIFLAGGGSGAARVTQYDAPKLNIVGPKVCGNSDSFVYPLLAWLWGLEGYYCPNVAEGISYDDIDHVLGIDYGPEEIEVYSSAIAYNFEPVTLSVVPVCTRVLCQCHILTLENLKFRLIEEPSLLLLEDNYPQDDTGVLAFYEDLTQLMNNGVIEAVCEGGGAIGMSTVDSLTVSPQQLLLEAMVDVNCKGFPVIYGIDFGHQQGPLSVIKFGSKWSLDYEASKGLLVKVE